MTPSLASFSWTTATETNAHTARHTHLHNLEVQARVLQVRFNDSGVKYWKRHKRQNQENEKVGGEEEGGGYIPELCVPQPGSNRVRLEPKCSQYLGHRVSPALPLLLQFPLQRVVSPALDCPTLFSIIKCGLHARSEEDGAGGHQL